MLESAKRKVRQREAVREQQIQLKSGFQDKDLPVEAIGNRGAGARSQKSNKKTKPNNKITGRAGHCPTPCNN